jgi:hypothetical protein
VSKLLAGEKFKPILVVRNFIGIFILFIWIWFVSNRSQMWKRWSPINLNDIGLIYFVIHIIYSFKLIWFIYRLVLSDGGSTNINAMLASQQAEVHTVFLNNHK